MSRWISQFLCNLDSSKNFTCPLVKLITEFTSLIAKPTSPGLSDTTLFARCPSWWHRVWTYMYTNGQFALPYFCPCRQTVFTLLTSTVKTWQETLHSTVLPIGKQPHENIRLQTVYEDRRHYLISSRLHSSKK